MESLSAELPRPPVSGRSLRTVVRVTLVVAGVALVVSLVAGLITFAGLESARDDLLDEVEPAVTSAARLTTAMADQQSGVRGFSLTGDPDFLGPWDEGRRNSAAEVDRLRELLANQPEQLARLEEVATELEGWQDDHARTLIAAAEAGRRGTPREFADSRVVLQQVRDGIDELVAELEVLEDEARAELEAASLRLVATLAAIALVLAGVIVSVALGLRTLVLRPVEQMVDDAGRIAMGELDHVPQESGLEEMAELGRSLDHVRSTLVAKLQEVSEREAELARSNSELEQFAYVASHDLQEPLRKVAAFCQMLERRYKGQLDERADTYIAFAVDGAKRMQELINDLLAFSRVGRTSDRFEDVDLDEVLDAALANLSSALEENGATVDRSPLPTIRGDGSLLVALFQNLVGNGIKFRSDAPPRIRISAEQVATDRWQFSVSDNGIGIPEEYRDRVFVIFQRLHARDEYDGTGIGLALCRKIVEFHGGRIDVDADHSGPGTTIRFTLQQDERSTVADEPQKVGSG